MKLAGPEPRFRFILNPHDMTVVVGGIFPPELAPVARLIAAAYIPVLEPSARAEWRAEMRQYEHELIHGKPSAVEPVGVLRAR